MALAPLAPPRDLTIPEPGSVTARDVLSRAIGRLLGELPRAGRGAAGSAAGREAAVEFARAAQGALARCPGAVASALRRPTAGALLRCLRKASGARAEALLGELGAILWAELAAAGALPERVRVRRAPRRIPLLSAGAVIELPPDVTGLVIEDGRVTVERAGGGAVVRLDELEGGEAAGAPSVRVARPYVEIEGEMVLALEDNNPLAMEEAHPDKEGNAVDLGGRGAGEWAEALRGALAPVERYLPDLSREMALYVQQVVPVGFDTVRHLSASYQEAIGTVYMSLHPSSMTLTEALIHEFSHNKINALFELDGVLENALFPLFQSPVRPDPRPLHGVLLAVHAFLPVARLYERMIEADDPLARHDSFRDRFARICDMNREGAHVVLRHGIPTHIGAGLMDEIARWRDHYDGVIRSPK
ncbi:MAG: hypothetical protein IT372_22350 [Polyangiaceae bacterium]|nr:hypothetical protein [Polyangiaceae bacterium]